MNLRGVRESGSFFAVPTYLFMVAILGMSALRPAAPAVRRPAPGRERRAPHRGAARLGRAADPDRPDVPAGARLLVRLCGADRRRGDQQRRTRLPQAQEPQRGHHAADAGPHRHLDDDERHRPRQPDGHPLRRPARARPAAHGVGRRAPGRLRAAPGDLPDRRRGLRRLPAGLLLRGHGHRHHPRARRQHGLQRLPGARVDPGPGRPRTALAGLAGRPPGLQQRHRLPRRHVHAADLGLRRRGDEADPALHRRRLRLLQPQPARHDPPLDAAPADRDGPGRTSPDDAVACDQHLRSLHDRRGAGHRGGHQVPRRRLDHDPGDGLLLRGHARDRAPLRPRRAASWPPTSRTR